MLPHANSTNNDLEDTELKYTIKSTKWYDQILFNRPLQFVLAILITGVAAPLLIYNFYFFHTFDLPPSDGYSIGSCLIPRGNRLPCGHGNVSHSECHQQCCYDLNSDFCFHRLPSRFSYIIPQPWNENIVLQPRVATVPYSMQNSLTNLRLSIDEISRTHLSLQYYDAKYYSFNGRRLADKDYAYEVTSPEVNVMVNSTYGTIFNTARGPLIASENIWELTFTLTNETMYGLGEMPLKENTVKILYNHDGGLSSVPLIYAKSNTSFHGLLIDSSDPTEVSIRGENQVVIRSISNQGIKIHLFIGPEPKNIMKDVLTVIGNDFDLEYWMLGVHICNEIPNTSLNEFISEAGNELPYESLCGSRPITFNSNHCNDSFITEFENDAAYIRRANKRFLPHVNPYIHYNQEKIDEEYTTTEKTNETLSTEVTDTPIDETTEASSQEYETEYNKTCKIIPTFKDVMYREPELLELYQGKVNDNEVIYPSYDNAPQELLEALWPYNTTVDAIVLENSWPLDERNKNLNKTNDLPYFNKNFEEVFQRTPKWNAKLNYIGKYMFKHNTYGNDFGKAISRVINKTNIWSSSQWMNGNFVINRQNINTSWTNLNRELVEAALGGISGHRFWSSPICGDTENFDIKHHASLCVKWYMAGIFFPIVKIHSKINARHPLNFTGTHKSLITETLKKRLSLLPYFYTILHEGPLLRPMFYQFPKTEALHNLTTQFSVGDDLLIIPNLHPSQSHVHVWMPPGSWYEFWSGLKLDGEEGEAVTMTTTEADFLTLIRGGSIVAIQKHTQETATSTRLLSSFSIIIALDCYTKNETKCQASGSLYIDKGMTLNFEATSTNLKILANGKYFDSLCTGDAVWANTITEIIVYGLDETSNNYDYSKHVDVLIYMCDLEGEEFVEYFFN